MPFATGFIVIHPRYREGERRREVLDHLARLGFEVYEVGRPAVVVYYVEAPTVKELEERIKAAEAHEGVLKAYIVYGFLAPDSVREWLNRAILEGEVELDPSMLEMLDKIISALTGKRDEGVN